MHDDLALARQRLAQLRRDGLTFDRAWAITLAELGNRTVDVLLEHEHVWRDAYLRRGHVRGVTPLVELVGG
jgi:hypothetical protein